MKKFKTIIKLFFTMLKIGLFTFGGGYAMVVLLENEFVERKKYMENDEFNNMVAIAESTPGPIAINCSTYIGYKLAGFWGSLFCTIAVCIPSFVIIYIISLFFDLFLSLRVVQYAFKGIQVCVSYLILSAGLKMIKQLKFNILSVILLISTILILVGFTLFSIKFSSIFYILIGAIMGLFAYVFSKIKSKNNKGETK